MNTSENPDLLWANVSDVCSGSVSGAGAVAVAAASPGWECSRARLGSHALGLAVAPSLDALLNSMKLAYMLHVYGLACLFGVMAFYTFFSLINLRALISSRPFMSSINLFLCLLGSCRAACLLFDPYGVKQMLPRVVGAMLWEFAYPCITSAFCLIQLAFMQLTQLKIGPEALRQRTFPSLVIATHFTFVLGVNVLLGYQESFLPYKYVGQTMFLVWGMILFCLFLNLSKHVRRLLNRVPQGVLLQRDPTDFHSKGIMQLAMLAPYSNLASSVAAALVPTLLAPKIRITDENDRTTSVPSSGRGEGAGGAGSVGSSSGSRRTTSTLSSARGVAAPVPAAAPAPSLTPSAQTARVSTPVPPPPPLPPPNPVPPAATPSPTEPEAPIVSVRPPTPTIMICPGSRRGSTASMAAVSRRGSSCLGGDFGDIPARRRSSSGLESAILTIDEGYSPSSRRASQASLLRIAEEGAGAGAGPDTLTTPQTGSPSRRKKSLSWKEEDDLCSASEPHGTSGKPQPSVQHPTISVSDPDDTATAETKLLPPSSDSGSLKERDDLTAVTLHSILNHIAYVNRGPRADSEDRERTKNRRRQLREVIDLTCATAALGMFLCLAELFQLYGPYGRLVGECDSGRGQPWVWFAFQTVCRVMELAMGCAMANVTKQPVSSRTPYLHHAHPGMRIKRESLYL